MENVYFKANFKPKKIDSFSCDLSLIEDVDESNNTIYVMKFFDELEKEQFAWIVRRLAILGGKYIKGSGIAFRNSPMNMLSRICEYQIIEQKE